MKRNIGVTQEDKLLERNSLGPRLLRRGRMSIGAITVTGFLGTFAGASLVIGWMLDLYGKRH